VLLAWRCITVVRSNSSAAPHNLLSSPSGCMIIMGLLMVAGWVVGTGIAYARFVRVAVLPMLVLAVALPSAATLPLFPASIADAATGAPGAAACASTVVPGIIIAAVATSNVVHVDCTAEVRHAAAAIYPSSSCWCCHSQLTQADWISFIPMPYVGLRT
jgi:hypothetical protein